MPSLFFARECDAGMRLRDSFDCHDGHDDRQISRNSCRVLVGKTGNTAKYDLSSFKNLRDLEVIEEARRENYSKEAVKGCKLL